MVCKSIEKILNAIFEIVINILYQITESKLQNGTHSALSNWLNELISSGSRQHFFFLYSNVDQYISKQKKED